MKKRRSDACELEEVERSLHTSFCAAANSISQLYTQSQQQQRIAFQAGQRQSLEKLNEWIQRQYQFGVALTTTDILNYVKNELDPVNRDETVVTQVQHQPPLPQQHQPSFSTFTRATVPSDQQKYSFPTGFSTGFQ
eukprot:c21138_g1_i1 orf=313-720(-)